ncbi:MAG: hypothetical protein ACFCU7_04965 [Pleurocapsa sp.]
MFFLYLRNGTTINVQYSHPRKCDRAIIADEWQKSSIIRREIELDAWVVMPNHFHGIVIIKNIVRKNRDRKVSNIAVVIVCTMNIR